MFKESDKLEVNVSLACSEEYIPFCTVTMVSILHNISFDKYNLSFYIIVTNITKDQKKKICSLKKRYHFNINFIYIDNSSLEKFNNIKLPPHVTKMTYARILLPDLLSDVNKVIFLDCDIIVKKDIGDLFVTDIGNNYYGMVIDACSAHHSKRLWGGGNNFDKLDSYYNCGVFLANLDLLRKIKYKELILSKITINYNKYQICDQDILNDSFKDNIYELNISWNFHHDKYIKLGYFNPQKYLNYDSVKQDPSIIHYTGVNKPWFPASNPEFKNLFTKYYKMCPFYKNISYFKYKLYNHNYVEILFKNIFLFQKIDNSVSRICNIKIPKLRLFNIINYYDGKNLSFKVIFFQSVTLIEKIQNETMKKLKILGIPLYYKKNLKRNLLKSNIQMILNQIESQNRNIQFLNKKVSNLKPQLDALVLHKDTFSKYKNIFNGKDVVLVCTGPTAKKYKMIKNAIHVGVNGAIYLPNVKLDFLFIQDYTIYQKNNSSLNSDAVMYTGNNCKKFYGIIADDRLNSVKTNIERIPLNFSFSQNTYQYVLEDIVCNKIAYDISREPFGDFSSTTFSALQFILYTNPKRIYFVGWDCGKGYAYNKTNAMNSADYQIKILKDYFLPHIRRFYSKIELISLNPVGLKGIFKDVYTYE